MSRPTTTASRALLLLAAVAGCIGPPDAPPVETGDREPIVGGVEERGFPLVGMLAGDYGGGTIAPFCTATPVTPTVLITAAHCTDAFNDLGGAPVIFARYAPGGTGPSHRVVSTSRRTHPQWSMTSYGYTYDIALVALQDRIDADVFPEQRRSRETSSDVGTPLKVVGYGVSSPPDGGAGTKRSIDMSITQIFGQYFVMIIDGWRGVCYGDSGGPSFRLGEHRDQQYGVHARTQVDTCGPAEDTSVGFFYADFVRPTVLALDPSAETCGDGICTGLENEAGCPSDCSPYVCGDGVRQGPEVCDDGNRVGGDGCSADCMSDETCGNGIVDVAVGEACDDGNRVDGDGCSADCRSNETCGNGIVDAAVGEVCDDGNQASGDGCSADCMSDETCGNGVVDVAAGEACDDGNHVDGDGCSADCRSNETCGNGIVDVVVGEVCDDGNQVSGDGCSADCRVAEGCGNGILEEHFGEVCDDGNQASGDGCSANCRSDETCGNGIVDVSVGEICDHGGFLVDDCPADCGVPAALPGGMMGHCSCRAAGARPPRSPPRPLVRLIFG